MKKINISYERLILFSVILIVICGSIVEWYAVNYSENHQSGWQFFGMIVMATIVIPLPLIIGAILDHKIKGMGKWFYLLTTLILVPGIYLLLFSGVLANWEMWESNHCLNSISDGGVIWNHFWSVYSFFCLGFTHSLRYRHGMKFITCAETSNRGFLILMS